MHHIKSKGFNTPGAASSAADLKADALPPTPGLEGRGAGGPESWKAICVLPK